MEDEYWLDDNGRNVIKCCRRYERGLKEIKVIYASWDGEKWKDLVTFDLSHGQAPHRDLRYLDIKDKRRKKTYVGMSLEEFFNEAVDDIYQNWRKYRDEAKVKH